MSDAKASKAAARAALKRAAASPAASGSRRGRTTVRTLGRDDQIAGLTEGRNAEASRRGSARALANGGPRPAAPPVRVRAATVPLPTPEVAQVCSLDGRRLTARLVASHLGWRRGGRLVATQVGVHAWTFKPATNATLRRAARAEVADDRGRLAFDLDFVHEANLRNWAAPVAFAAEGVLWLVDIAALSATPTPATRRKATSK